jgi:hypothetical protein
MAVVLFEEVGYGRLLDPVEMINMLRLIGLLGLVAAGILWPSEVL